MTDRRRTTMDAEPGRALRATFRPGAVFAADRPAARVVAFSTPAGLSVWRVLVAAYPWPAALYQGPCPPAAATALLLTRRPFGFASGAEERLDRPETGHPVPGRRHHHGYLRTVPRAAWGRAVRTQAGWCGVARACYCQHKTHSGKPAAVSPGPEREAPAENGTGSVGAVGHTAGNEGRTP